MPRRAVILTAALLPVWGSPVGICCGDVPKRSATATAVFYKCSLPRRRLTKRHNRKWYKNKFCIQQLIQQLYRAENSKYRQIIAMAERLSSVLGHLENSGGKAKLLEKNADDIVSDSCVV
jgi:hypothetical protein